MARIETDPNYSSPTFSRATAAADLFKKEDVQNLAAAMSAHDHSATRGVRLGPSSITWPLVVPDGNNLQFGNANKRIRGPVNNFNDIAFENAGGNTIVAASQGSFLTNNAYFDGTAWQRFATVNSASQLAVGGGLTWGYVAAGSNPASFVTKFSVGGDGTVNLYGPVILTGSSFLFTTLGTQLQWVDGNSKIFVDNPNRTMYFDTFNSDWLFRNTGAGSAQRFQIQSNGNIVVTGSGYFQGATIYLGTTTNTLVQSDNSNTFVNSVGAGVYLKVASSVYVQNNSQAAFMPIAASAFNVNSTRRIKDNIVPLRDPLAIVCDERIHGVSYIDANTGEANVGFVAEDFLDVLPEVVGAGPSGETEFLNYGAVGAVTFEALKILAARVAALETQLAEVKAA